MKSKNNSILNNTLEDERFKSFDLQVCLDNIDSDTLKVIEIIQETTKNILIEYVDRIIRLRERKPRCPHCRSYKISNHEIEDRKLHFYHATNFELKVDRYKCRKCNRIFMADLTSMVRKSANFTHDAYDNSWMIFVNQNPHYLQQNIAGKTNLTIQTILNPLFHTKA